LVCLEFLSAPARALQVVVAAAALDLSDNPRASEYSANFGEIRNRSVPQI
jgi:hypothetical protein